MKNRIDGRLYLALFYLNKGKYNLFYDLICTKNTDELQIKDSEDLMYLQSEGYIDFKNNKLIIIKKKGIELLNKKPNVQKEKREEITNSFITDFIKGFPSMRISKTEEIKRELELFYTKYNYNLDILLKAKDEYIQNQAKSNFVYTHNVVNFILEKLDSYCRFILTKEKAQEETSSSDILL